MGLLTTIKTKPVIRSIFGKKELDIIEKQLLGIKLTPSETTRLSRDIRKKLIAVKELCPSIGEFDLKKGSELKYVIDEAKAVILESEYARSINNIFLFGSTASGTRGLNSDIDIAVEFSKINSKEASKFRVYVAARVPEIVDIQVFNTLPLNVQRSILNKHKVIWQG
ncbi:MAG: nucleotidyltransferase domain-containing protein [Nanoarchaeota archaeon]|nr:nucleotidyltransferase domain-containing protein [Nanoarchaeota archaeon]MBU1704171.1 nucleotidyltransferase domain-containing protein [Nanoarchaeota archaeon]